ncbi:hypothetical protein HWV62_13235 [Athelia sp. TMB]|nr:hypothetical protein HWV62_13235 [Athelia sp. TMB]
MERFCGALQPAIRSQRFPYASLDRHVTEIAQLTQIKIIYNVHEELSLKLPRGAVAGLFSDLSYPSCVLLPPHVKAAPAANILAGITTALATRFGVTVTIARAFMRNAKIEQWGKVRRVDSTEGDTMRAIDMGHQEKPPSPIIANNAQMFTNIHIWRSQPIVTD